MSAEAGPRLTDELMERVSSVLHECLHSPVSIQSNFARTHAFEFGVAASLGLITTETPEGYSRQWRCTVAGLSWIYDA